MVQRGEHNTNQFQCLIQSSQLQNDVTRGTAIETDEVAGRDSYKYHGFILT